MTQIPETTLKLLNAARTASGTTDGSTISRVVIRGEGKGTGIFYFPQKSRFTSKCIELAGISELVSLFLFDSTRPRVARHFRDGAYDISGNEIRVIR